MEGAPEDPRRALLLDLYRVALSAVDSRRRMRAALASDHDQGPSSILAIGKAAPGMAMGALDVLGKRLEHGLVIAPGGAFSPELLADPRVTCLAGGHPLPDEQSLAAGKALHAFARAVPRGSGVLLLISGGASALVELPAPGVTLADLRRLNSWAQTAGIDIVTLNAMRGALSLIKAGRLPGLFAGAELDGFLISDVPGDDPAIVGSGLLAASSGMPLTAAWPDWLVELAARAAPGPATAAVRKVTLVACLSDALDAAERAARSHGLSVLRKATRLAGDAEAAARNICHELAVADEVLQLWGGETVVKLPASTGRGGRCQHLALAAAQHIEGHAEFVVLAAGTDGRDGNSEDAGAIVDGETLQRARVTGYDAARSLATADAGRLLEAAGDLVHTGPTGTNVGDLVMAARIEPNLARAL